MKDGDGFEAAELPWFLTPHWGWLLVAELAGAAIRIHFNWHQFPSLDVLLVWSFLQAGWLSRVDQRSTTVYWYLADLVLWYLRRSVAAQEQFPAVGVVLALAIAVIAIVSLFHFRRDMERYFKDTDDFDLNLSGGMIWFFNTLYFQDQFRRVADLRRSGSLEITPAAG